MYQNCVITKYLPVLLPNWLEWGIENVPLLSFILLDFFSLLKPAEKLSTSNYAIK